MKEWVPYKLKEITTKIGSGSTPTGGKEAYYQSGITLVRSLNVYDFVFELENLAFINEAQAKKLNGVTIEKDDILLNITGASVGRCTIMPENLLPARVNQHVSIIRCNKEIADAKFLLYCINSASYKDALMSIADSGATREALTKDDIEKFQVLLPTLQLQQRIASILSAYDDLIEVNNQRIKLLEETARELYKEWFVRMRFPGYKNAKFVKGVPEGWEVVGLKDISKLHDNRRKPLSDRQRALVPGNYPYYGAAKIFDYIGEFIFDGKYLLFAEDGSVEDENGYPVLQLVNEKCWVNNHAHVLTGLLKEGVSTELLFLFLSQYPISGLITGVAQPKISQGNMYRIKFLKPRIELLNQFNDIIIPLFDLRFNLIQQNTQLRQIRDRLLPRLISGKLEVKGKRIFTELKQN